MARKNPKGEYSGTLKLPSYIDRAVAFVLHDGPRVLDWEWDRRMSPENKKHFHDFLVSVHHPLAYEAGTPEQRFKRFIMEYVMPYIRKNPGARWHAKKEREADQQDKHAKKKWQKDFFHGKAIAHMESGLAAEAMGMGLRRVRKNPLAVFSLGNPRKTRTVRAMPRARRNPSRRISAGVAGVLYGRCLGIEGEKTSVIAERAGFKRGKYYHPFEPASGVEVLALDNGDLLLHSTRRVRLW